MGQITRLVKSILANVSPIYNRSLSDDLTLRDDLRLSDSDLNELYHQLELEFNINIQPKERAIINTVRELILHLANKLYRG